MKRSTIFVLLIIGVALLIGGHLFFQKSNTSQPAFFSRSTISGTVYFDDYQQGFIEINVFDKPNYQNRTIIATTKLDKPGTFQVTVPSALEEVYILGYNDSANDGAPFSSGDPFCVYGKGTEPDPILLDRPLIDKVALVFQQNAIPESEFPDMTDTDILADVL